jgi:hypothetical protein
MVRCLILAVGIVFLSPPVASAATIRFAAVLAGRYEVPRKDSAGKGSLTATLDTATRTLTYALAFSGLDGPATAAHFHGPATAMQSAAVTAPIGGPDPVSPVTGSLDLTIAQMRDLRAGRWYVNVHTAAHPGGAIRGQVLRVPGRRGRDGGRE